MQRSQTSFELAKSQSELNLNCIVEQEDTFHFRLIDIKWIVHPHIVYDKVCVVMLQCYNAILNSYTQ